MGGTEWLGSLPPPGDTGETEAGQRGTAARRGSSAHRDRGRATLQAQLSPSVTAHPEPSPGVTRSRTHSDSDTPRPTILVPDGDRVWPPCAECAGAMELDGDGAQQQCVQ